MASRRRLRRTGCTKKRAYTENDANKKAWNLRQLGIEVHYYRCTFGNHWHVGHRPNKLTRLIDDRQGMTTLKSTGRFKRFL